MRLVLEESYPGEVSDSPEDAAQRARAALSKALEQLGMPRGGELVVVAELATQMEEAYAATFARMVARVKAKAREA